MADIRIHSQVSNLIRFVLKHATTGQGLTGLTSASSGLIISTIADVEATATTYTAAGSTIETITTLGTFAAPTATKCRFKEVDATNHPGLYEFQFADARFAVSDAKRLIVSASGATNLLNADYEIQLDVGTLLADQILLRNVSNVEATAGEHTLCTVVLGMLETSISGTTLLIKRTNGSTTHATKTLTLDAAAEPIIGVA